MIYSRLQLDSSTFYFNTKKTSGLLKVSTVKTLEVDNSKIDDINGNDYKPPHC